MEHSGLQLATNHAVLPNSVWVLGPDVIIDKNGNIVNQKESNYVWLNHIDCRTMGLALPSSAIPVHLPLSVSGLVQLVDAMSAIWRHTLHPALLTLDAGVMVLHYSQLIRKRGHCHVPILYGISQTGKTTALQFALSLFGLTFYSRGSKEAYLQKCCSSTFPVGCDAPQSKASIGQLIVELFNGAKCTLVKYGDKIPITSCIISANFKLSEAAKYVMQVACMYSFVCLPFLAVSVSFSCIQT